MSTTNAKSVTSRVQPAPASCPHTGTLPALRTEQILSACSNIRNNIIYFAHLFSTNSRVAWLGRQTFMSCFKLWTSASPCCRCVKWLKLSAVMRTCLYKTTQSSHLLFLLFSVKQNKQASQAKLKNRLRQGLVLESIASLLSTEQMWTLRLNGYHRTLKYGSYYYTIIFENRPYRKCRWNCYILNRRTGFPACCVCIEESAMK
jgi:hypothetical protein